MRSATRLFSQRNEGIASLTIKSFWGLKAREYKAMSSLAFPCPKAVWCREMDAVLAEPNPPPLVLVVYGMRLMAEPGAEKDAAMVARLEAACRLVWGTAPVNRQSQALLLEWTAVTLFLHNRQQPDSGAAARAVLLARQRLSITEVPPAALPAETLSVCCLSAGELELARQYAEASLKEEPCRPQAVISLARTEMKAGNWQRCLKLLEPLTEEEMGGHNVPKLRAEAAEALSEYLKSQQKTAESQSVPRTEKPATAPKGPI